MENKQRNTKKFMVSIMFFAIVAFAVSSCNKSDDPISSQNSQTASNESSQESATDELDDMANVALNSNTAAGGRAETITDDRLNCDGTTIAFSGTGDAGTATITFGANGCTDKKGNVRKGKIMISWTGGKWYAVGSSHTITLDGYSINGIAITGTRTVTTTAFSITNTNFTLTSTVAANHTITWPDATFATRVVAKTRTWAHTATEDTITESNGPGSEIAASGTNRHLKAYKTTITSPLTYLGSCVKSNKIFIPVSGTKVITDITLPDHPVSLTVDFGTGACDNSFTLTVDGHSKTIGASGD